MVITRQDGKVVLELTYRETDELYETYASRLDAYEAYVADRADAPEVTATTGPLWAAYRQLVPFASSGVRAGYRDLEALADRRAAAWAAARRAADDRRAGR